MLTKVSIICAFQRNTFKPKYNNAETIDVVLSNAAEEHQDLVNNTNLLISAFSYQLLLCFVSALIISVTGLYLICKRITQKHLNELMAPDDPLFQNETDYNWWALSCYPLLHSILIGSVITVCHSAVSQVSIPRGCF